MPNIRCIRTCCKHNFEPTCLLELSSKQVRGDFVTRTCHDYEKGESLYKELSSKQEENNNGKEE